MHGVKNIEVNAGGVVNRHSDGLAEVCQRARRPPRRDRQNRVTLLANGKNNPAVATSFSKMLHPHSPR